MAGSTVPHWRVSPDGPWFERDGERTFLLADTLWAAFSRMTEHEWDDAIRLRRRQGFTAVNVSVLPIPHDRSLSRDARAPFAVDAEGGWDLDRLNEEYWVRAGRMVRRAAEQGITTVLVVLWCNYAPGTWGADRTPWAVLNDAQTDAVVERAVAEFARSGAIFCVSGDESLRSESAIARYERAASRIRSLAPTALITWHTTPSTSLPASIAVSDDIDYYSYQAGHDVGWQDRAVAMAREYADLKPTRPVVSMEPPYEAHGYGGGTFRHTARTVRRASWTGVLGGAVAGLGYGAHGSWSWHRLGDAFNGEDFSGIPLPAQRALELPGAWDVGLLRTIVEGHGLHRLRSADAALVDDRTGARFGMSVDSAIAAIYVPEPFRVRVRGDFGGHALEVWDLAAGRRDHVERSVADRVTTFGQPDTTGDLLYVLSRRD
ncbi:DUF4038 domain-containing protein [Galbitalea sp. SE-J8]|nr:DUF4038 domain-containing protein [Galbitalea sp. SE-J8]MDM4761550.1 DUF4038 domain-containing protein [Galbitalea sp. SE-J8]